MDDERDETGDRRSAVCYLNGEYPAPSHTFIDREIQAIRGSGIRVETVSLHRTPAHLLLTPHDRSEDANTWAIQPIKPIPVVRAHLRVLRRSPRRYLSALAFARTLGAAGLRGGVRKLFYWAEAVVLADHLHGRGITHVHAHFANSASWVALLAARLTGGTWSFTMHGPTEFDDAEYFALRQKIADAAFVACIGDYCRSQLMRKSSEEDWTKLVTVRCGVDGATYAPAPEARGRGATEPPMILSVGRLMADKGQHVLVDALAALAAEGFDVRARIVGDGPNRAQLQRQINEAGLAERIELLGSVGQDRLPELYRASDLFVLSSFAEGIPVVVMEAMASAVPVIATSVMGLSELVTAGLTGRLVQPGRPDQLARQIRSALEDGAATAKMSEAARARVASEFTYPANIAPLADQFRRVTRSAQATS